MKPDITSLYTLILILFGGLNLMAQPPGGRPGGFDPNEMVKREKQNVLEQVTELSADQKLLLEGIYDEFSMTVKETFEEGRGGDREVMRAKMQGLRKEKDALVFDVLNEIQFEEYKKITGPRDRRRPDDEAPTNPNN